MKVRLIRILALVSLVLLLGLGGWHFFFNKDISLPDAAAITKIEVWQNDFQQKAQQISYIEEKPKIEKVYQFIEQRRKGWERLLYSSPAVVVTAHFYKADRVLFRLYLMKNSNFILGNRDGTYLRSLNQGERDEFVRLLGVQTGKLVTAPHGKKPL
jgi:hypothetical protein